MIIQISGRFARWLKDADPYGPVSFEVMKYALSVLINLLLVVGLCLLIGYIDGKFVETVVAVCSFVGLRMFSGGFHFKSLEVCVIASVALLTAVPVLSPYVLGHSVWLGGLSLLLVLLKAPTSISGTRLTERHKPLFKAISAVIVCTNFFIGSPVIAISFLLQSLLLIPRRR
ncbi:accessory gene regulator B family protein [Paenibacillus chitinolyticus]|uniref:accessory gene regulator B family protein n=1 Tax=Paenibacillus chitinolyticus TaxID=79263 RepID=UPI0035D834DB